MTVKEQREKVKCLAKNLLESENSGHGFDHIERVVALAQKFAKREKADITVVTLAALLHDADDYKLVGVENAKKLSNAKDIMAKAEVNKKLQSAVIDIIENMGYSKRLAGVLPKTLENKIVSDADMCDAIGAHGIIRSIVYAVSGKGGGVIFDKDVLPNMNISVKEYNSNGNTHATDNAINHFFEKLLKIKDLCLTDSGRKEALKRHGITVDFLRHFFIEEDLPDWMNLLKTYTS